MDETFGERLARLRTAAGINQGVFAACVGVGQSQISMLEQGQREGMQVRSGTLLAMAEMLGVSMEFLLTGQARTRGHRSRARQETTG